MAQPTNKLKKTVRFSSDVIEPKSSNRPRKVRIAKKAILKQDSLKASMPTNSVKQKAPPQLQEVPLMQDTLALFSTSEHQLVNINANAQGVPTSYHCQCGERVLRGIQFLRHLIHKVAEYDLEVLAEFSAAVVIKLREPGEVNSGNISEPGISKELCLNLGVDRGSPGSMSVVGPMQFNPILLDNFEDTEELELVASGTQAQARLEATVPSADNPNDISNKRKNPVRGKVKNAKINKLTAKQNRTKTKGKVPKKAVTRTYTRSSWDNKDGHGIKGKIDSGEFQGRYECFCGVITKTRSSIHRHVRVKRGEIQWPCEEPGCGKIYSQKHTLVSHLKTHKKLDPDPDPLAIAPQTNQNQKLVLVTKSAPTAPPILVEHEQAEIASTPPLRSTRRSQGREAKPESIHTREEFPCTEEGCAKVYYSKKGLELHIIAHHDCNSVICPKCGLEVKYATYLRAHQKTKRCRTTKLTQQEPEPSKSSSGPSAKKRSRTRKILKSVSDQEANPVADPESAPSEPEIVLPSTKKAPEKRKKKRKNTASSASVATEVGNYITEMLHSSLDSQPDGEGLAPPLQLQEREAEEVSDFVHVSGIRPGSASPAIITSTAQVSRSDDLLVETSEDASQQSAPPTSTLSPSFPLAGPNPGWQLQSLQESPTSIPEKLLALLAPLDITIRATNRNSAALNYDLQAARGQMMDQIGIEQPSSSPSCPLDLSVNGIHPSQASPSSQNLFNSLDAISQDSSKSPTSASTPTFPSDFC